MQRFRIVLLEIKIQRGFGIYLNNMEDIFIPKLN